MDPDGRLLSSVHACMALHMPGRVALYSSSEGLQELDPDGERILRARKQEGTHARTQADSPDSCPGPFQGTLRTHALRVGKALGIPMLRSHDRAPEVSPGALPIQGTLGAQARSGGPARGQGAGHPPAHTRSQIPQEDLVLCPSKARCARRQGGPARGRGSGYPRAAAR